MWDEDWARLGIEPTTELAAIKKAYALKLKVTRPDDDAEAYQALRAAYERVQQSLKWQQQPPGQADAGAQATNEANVGPEPASEPVHEAAPPEPLTAPAVDPRHLIDELVPRWRQSGEPALLQAWHATRQALDQQPLARQAEFSAAFAHWVLGTPDLPDAFLKQLNDHFGWLDDFRTERLLGVALAHALHEALDMRLRRTAVEPVVLALAQPLQGMATLRDGAPGWLKMQLLWLALGPLLTRNQGLLGPAWLARLGLPATTQSWLKRGQKVGFWTRAALGTAGMTAAAYAMVGNFVVAIAHALTWLVVTGALAVAGLLVGMLLHTGPTLTTPSRRWALPLERWRRHRMQPVLGLAWLLFAAWMAWLADAPAAEPTGTGRSPSLLPAALQAPAAWLFGLAGLVAAWPLTLLAGCIVAGLAPLTGSLLVVALTPWLPLPSSLLIATAWMLLAAAVHEERLSLSGVALWPLRPMLNSLAVAQRWTYSVALVPLACCSAYLMLVDGPVRPLTVFLIWVVSILPTAWLQGKAEAWGLRQLPPAPQA